MLIHGSTKCLAYCAAVAAGVGNIVGGNIASTPAGTLVFFFEKYDGVFYVRMVCVV